VTKEVEMNGTHGMHGRDEKRITILDMTYAQIGG
jgi:hypothetical protein